MLCSCGNNENRYVVEGNLEGINETVYLFDRQQQLLDSAKVENGAFRIEGVAEAPRERHPDRCPRHARNVRRHADPRTGHDHGGPQRAGAERPVRDRHRIERRQHGLHDRRQRADPRIPRSGDHRRAPRGHRGGVRGAGQPGPRAEPQQLFRRGDALAAGLRTFGPGDSGRDRPLPCGVAADRGNDQNQGERRAEAQDRRGTALYRRRTARRRRQGGVAQIRRREPGDEIRPARLLGFVVRSLHGRGSPPEEDLRGVPR